MDYWPNIIGEILGQGLLGALGLAGWFMAWFLFRKYDTEKEKRVQDGKDYMTATMGAMKDLTNAVDNLQKAEDMQSQILRTERIRR